MSVPKPPRARPLDRADRRAAVIDATVPLLAVHGVGVTTRQIAEAAEVAEGTLFRVFADKDEIVQSALVSALDPAPLVAAMAAIDRRRPLAMVVDDAVRLLLAHQRRVVALLPVAHHLHAAGSLPKPTDGDPRTHSVRAVLAAITDLFASHQAALRLPPPMAAVVLVSMVHGTSLPTTTGGIMLDQSLIVDVVLHGIQQMDPATSVPPPFTQPSRTRAAEQLVE